MFSFFHLHRTYLQFRYSCDWIKARYSECICRIFMKMKCHEERALIYLIGNLSLNFNFPAAGRYEKQVLTAYFEEGGVLSADFNLSVGNQVI